MISRDAMWVVLLVLVLVVLVTAALLLSSYATAQVSTILGGYDAGNWRAIEEKTKRKLASKSSKKSKKAYNINIITPLLNARKIVDADPAGAKTALAIIRAHALATAPVKAAIQDEIDRIDAAAAAAAVVPVNSANDAPQVNRAALMERAALLRRADQLSALPAVIVGDESVSAPLGDGGAAPLIAVGSPASQDVALIARAKDAPVYIVVIDKPGDEGALLAAAGVDIGTTVPISKRTSSGGAPATGWLYQVVKVPGGGTRRAFINYINPAEKRYTP